MYCICVYILKLEITSILSEVIAPRVNASIYSYNIHD